MRNPHKYKHTDLTVLNPDRVLEKCESEGCENPPRKPNKRNDTGTWRYYSYCEGCINCKYRYGITVPERQILVDSQNNKCAICKDELEGWGRGWSSKSSAVDHCHRTGKVRGILCYHCNTGIGQLKESVEILKLAISYLEKVH
jgi:hypothetical protein